MLPRRVAGVANTCGEGARQVASGDPARRAEDTQRDMQVRNCNKPGLRTTSLKHPASIRRALLQQLRASFQVFCRAPMSLKQPASIRRASFQQFSITFPGSFPRPEEPEANREHSASIVSAISSICPGSFPRPVRWRATSRAFVEHAFATPAARHFSVCFSVCLSIFSRGSRYMGMVGIPARQHLPGHPLERVRVAGGGPPPPCRRFRRRRPKPDCRSCTKPLRTSRSRCWAHTLHLDKKQQMPRWT